MRIGKYEVGRTLGEGNFAKVKLARNLDTGHPFAIKILDKGRILNRNVTDQIKREIATLKLLRHPNIVRLHEVLASKSKIYMVLDYVTGGELYDRIAFKGRVSEAEGRKLFHQLIDGVSYCHNHGVFHRDLKLENVLLDAKGRIKISDFGLSALPKHFRDDGLLHTICGSPNYVAPEVLKNKGYDGATADIWSCGVILYVVLTGSLPFDDRNLAVLYHKISKGEVQIPKWMSSGAENMIKRILDPNPLTRITMVGIKADEWFKQDYVAAAATLFLLDDEEYIEGDLVDEDDEDDVDDDERSYRRAVTNLGGGHSGPGPRSYPSSSVTKLMIPAAAGIVLQKTQSLPAGLSEASRNSSSSNRRSTRPVINAFQLIGMSSCLDLSGFFEEEDVSERKVRFAVSDCSFKHLLKKMEDVATEMGFHVRKILKNHHIRPRLMIMKVAQNPHMTGSAKSNLSVAAEVLEISPSLYVVELQKSCGDSSVYRQLCEKLSNDLGSSSSSVIPKSSGTRALAEA